MKESKTKKISKILEEMEKEQRQEVFKLFDASLKEICCENVDWLDFQVFLPSCKMVKEMLMSLTPEYILTVCDKVNQCYCENVKITVLKNRKETFIDTVKLNVNTMLVYIEISSKRVKEIERRLAL